VTIIKGSVAQELGDLLARIKFIIAVPGLNRYHTILKFSFALSESPMPFLSA
jgi:hypothetical protein